MTRATLLLCALLAGCATHVETVVLPCPAAVDLPAAPARTVQTSTARPGAVVRATIINRAQWIAHADELTARLKKCKP